MPQDILGTSPGSLPKVDCSCEKTQFRSPLVIEWRTQQSRRWNPGDAANVFVRVLLSDAGAMLGGLKEDEWRKTLEWFDGRCAYTGQTLGEGETERDHAIPMNRTHCGLHL